MPTCGTLTGRYEPCKQYVGGIKGAFFIPFEFDTTITTDGSGLITQIVDTSSPPVKVTGYFWELKGLSTIETSIVASRDNGTAMYETIFTLSFKPSGVTPVTGDVDMDAIQTLTKGRWQIVVWDRNDQFWLIGQTLGCDANGGSSSWGVQMGDARLNTITFSSQEKLPPGIIDAETYTELESVITISPAV